MDKAITLTAGLFVMIALVGGVYLIDNIENTYTCDMDGDTIVGECFKLSSVNSEGIQTRCYYNESSPRKYKICKNGWNKYKGEANITGTPINLSDRDITIEEEGTGEDLTANDYPDKQDAIDAFIAYKRDREIAIAQEQTNIVYTTDKVGEFNYANGMIYYSVCFTYDYNDCIMVTEDMTAEEIDEKVYEAVSNSISKKYPKENIRYIETVMKGRELKIE